MVFVASVLRLLARSVSLFPGWASWYSIYCAHVVAPVLVPVLVPVLGLIVLLRFLPVTAETNEYSCRARMSWWRCVFVVFCWSMVVCSWALYAFKLCCVSVVLRVVFVIVCGVVYVVKGM